MKTEIDFTNAKKADLATFTKREIETNKQMGHIQINEWGAKRVYRITAKGNIEYLTGWIMPRGGKREGAGRPNKDGYKRIQINARIAKGAYDKLMNLKEDKSLGDILDEIIYNYNKE